MKLILSTFCSLILLSCSHSGDVQRKTASVPDVVNSFDSFNSIRQLASNTKPEFVKFVIDVSGENWTVQFFNSKKYTLHTSFLKESVGLTETSEDLYKLAHFNEGRKYFFGALFDSSRRVSGNSGQNFQISAVDLLKEDDLVKIDKLLKKSILFDAGLEYLPAGSQADFVYNKKNKESLEFKGVKIASDSILKSEIYAQGFTVGTLRVLNAAKIEAGDYIPNPTDIVVLDYAPISLSPVRGVITSRPTSSNSHVSLLADMLSIPFVFVAEANKKKRFKDLEGKKVFFKPFAHDGGESPFTLMEIDDDVYSKFNKVLKNRFPKIKLKANHRKISNFRGFPKLASSDQNLTTGLCGAKASNSDFLREALSVKFGAEQALEKSLDGFCIPFYYFDVFMKMNKRGSLNLRAYALKELSDLGLNPKVEDIQEATSNIQKAINDARVSDRHLEEIRLKVEEHYASNPLVKKVRFRSSSNAEDDKRFNGAGLYGSDGVKLKHFKKKNLAKIEEALKTVWSSLYSVRAYTARRQFKIDESQVYMGVLVNQAFDEDARGVALCKKERRSFECRVEGFPGGEYKVTHPPKGKLAEVSRLNLYTYTDGDKLTQYFTSQLTTELPQGSRLFTEEESESLLEIFDTLYKAWSNERNTGTPPELDFEWKRMKRADGSTYMLVKQMREVPALNVAGFEQPIFMIDKNELLFTSPQSNEYGPVGHSTWAEYKVDIPVMQSFKDFKNAKNDVKFEISDFLFSNKKLNVQKVNSVTEDEWVGSDYEEGAEEKTHRILLETDHPNFKDLNISIDYRALKNNGKIITDNIVTIDQAIITRLVNKSHYPYWTPADDYYLFKNKYVSNRFGIVSQDSYSNLPRTKNFCHKGKLIFQAEMTKANTGVYLTDGSYPVDTIRIFKEGLPTKINKDFEVKGPIAAFGFGDSHAEDTENIVSYQYSAVISDEQRVDLGLNKARFFVISEYYTYANQRTFYTTFDINMNQLKKIKIDRFCPGEDPNAEGAVDEGFNADGFNGAG